MRRDEMNERAVPANSMHFTRDGVNFLEVFDRMLTANEVEAIARKRPRSGVDVVNMFNPGECEHVDTHRIW